MFTNYWRWDNLYIYKYLYSIIWFSTIFFILWLVLIKLWLVGITYNKFQPYNYSWTEGMDSGCHGNRKTSSEAKCLHTIFCSWSHFHLCRSNLQRYLHRSVPPASPSHLACSDIPLKFLVISDINLHKYWQSHTCNVNE